AGVALSRWRSPRRCRGITPMSAGCAGRNRSRRFRRMRRSRLPSGRHMAESAARVPPYEVFACPGYRSVEANSDRLVTDVGLQGHRTRVAEVQAGGQLPFVVRRLPAAVAVIRRPEAIVDRDPDRRTGHDMASHQLGPEFPLLDRFRGRGEERLAVVGGAALVAVL